MYKLAKIIPSLLRRRLEVFLIDHGFPPERRWGAEGIGQLGHRGYVGKASRYDTNGRRQLEFLVGHGLQRSTSCATSEYFHVVNGGSNDRTAQIVMRAERSLTVLVSSLDHLSTRFPLTMVRGSSRRDHRGTFR